MATRGITEIPEGRTTALLAGDILRPGNTHLVNACHFSLIVPCLDTRVLTLKCLESLEAARRGQEEVIVVDDCSRDGTPDEIARRFPWVRLIRQEHRGGFTVSANRGIRAARGRVLILLNSDTEVRPESLEWLDRALSDNPLLGIAGAQLTYPDGRDQWSGGAEPSLLWLFGLTANLPGLLGRIPGYRSLRPVRGATGERVEWVTGAAMAIRHEVLQQVGLLDERFGFYCQDLDLCLRAARAGWEVGVVKGFQVLHHQGATIMQGGGSGSGSQNAELLYSDLLRWAHKTKGEAWARRAARTMRLGARLRMQCRRLLTPLSRRDSRAWRLENQELARAHRLLTLKRALGATHGGLGTSLDPRRAHDLGPQTGYRDD